MSWTGKSLLFSIVFLICHPLPDPADQAFGATVLQNFDSIPVTGENEVPSDGGSWVYSSRKTNPQYPPAAYNRCGWSDQNKYAADNSVYDSISTSGVSSNSPRGYIRYQYLEIDGTNRVHGNSLKQVITGGYYTEEDECGLELQNKEELLEYQNGDTDPICRDDSARVGYPYIYITNSSLSYNPVPFEDAKNANRFSMYIKLPDHFRNGPSLNYNLASSTINLGPYTDIGGHFYHWYYNEGGGWIHILMDGHPQHNNAWGSAELYPYVNYGIRSYDINYFNELYRMYVMAFDYNNGLLGSGSAPYATYYDEMEFFYDPEPQNDETIASPAIGFFPSRDNAFDIGFNDKYRNRAELNGTYEIKYSFSIITNDNYDDAKYVRIQEDERYGGITANNAGLISKISPYFNGVWAPFKIDESDEALLKPGNKIYFAIKDITNRDYSTGLYDTEGDTAIVPNTGGKRRIDLIKRIDYLIPAELAPPSTEDEIPVIDLLTAMPSSGGAPLEVRFSCAAHDPEGSAVIYLWDFGDGATGSGQSPIHTYTRTGSYTVTLTVTDVGGLAALRSATISVAEPETASQKKSAILKYPTWLPQLNTE